MRFAMRNKNWRMGSVNTENKVKFEVASCKEIGDSRGVYLETRASEPWHFQRILFYFYYTLLDLIIPDYEMFKTWEENFSIDFNWNCKNPFDRFSVFSFFLSFFFLYLRLISIHAISPVITLPYWISICPHWTLFLFRILNVMNYANGSLPRNK